MTLRASSFLMFAIDRSIFLASQMYREEMINSCRENAVICIFSKIAYGERNG